jgi:RNA polymerase sigma-70 factor (ECF subfamily)
MAAMATGSEDEPTSGPEADFGTRVAAEVPGLYRYAVFLTGDPDGAEDLVGETVLRALDHRAQFRGDASLRTWLHRILHHLAVDRGRHRSHEVAVGEVEALWQDENYSVDPEIAAEVAQSKDAVRDALLHLPEGYRSVVVLHDAEGWPSTEIARMLHLSLPAVKQRLRRGRMMAVSALAQAKERQVANVGVPLSCWEAREQVSDYLDDDLSADARARLEAHLAGCATCPPLFQALVGVRSALGSLHDPDSVVPAGLAERVRSRIETC